MAIQVNNSGTSPVQALVGSKEYAMNLPLGWHKGHYADLSQ